MTIKNSGKKTRKIAFLDRDGALIFEPPVTEQVDSVEQLEILPGVIKNLKRLQELDYLLAMVTNQDGLGTTKNPQENFDAVQNELFVRLGAHGIKFERVFVCPHFPEEKCACRKPKTALVEEFLRESPIDYEKSLMVGDRESDRQFAKNLGIRFFKMETNGIFPDIEE